MVFDDLGDTVRGLLGEEQNQESNEEDNIVEDEFNEIYNDEIVESLKDHDYQRAERLIERTDREFENVMDEFIEDRLNSGSYVLNNFQKRKSRAEGFVKEGYRKVRELQEDGVHKVEKLGAKPAVKGAKSHVKQLNSEQATQAMRDSFEAFHMAASAADYIDQREDLDTEHNTNKVKVVADKKASELQDLDRDLGRNFMVREYRNLERAYNEL